MIAAPESQQFTPQEYLDWEVQQDLRYEYIDGEVYAMTGGTLPHADIAFNFASVLRGHLQGRCKVRLSDAKVGITDVGPFTYPDISVTCDERDRTAQQFSRHPCLISEVLSPSTEAYDRGGKFALYRRLESLEEYVLISSQFQGIEVFRRNAQGQWLFLPCEQTGQVQLESVGLTIPTALIYENVVLGITE